MEEEMLSFKNKIIITSENFFFVLVLSQISDKQPHLCTAPMRFSSLALCNLFISQFPVDALAIPRSTQPQPPPSRPAPYEAQIGPTCVGCWTTGGTSPTDIWKQNGPKRSQLR